MLLTDVSDVKCFLRALFAIAEDCKTCEALDYMDDYMSYMECMD